MMFFLQDPKESNTMEVEILELKSELDRNLAEKDHPFKHRYQVVDSNFFKGGFDNTPNPYNPNSKISFKEWMRDCAIPVGSLEFVGEYLKQFHGISHMNPIEVPECLRLPHILLRNYKIVSYDNIPRDGNYFVKDVSEIKGFTYQGNMNALFSEDFGQDEFDKTHLYQVSELLDIVSEYRVIVMGSQIYGIQFYDGDPTVMPTPKEINKIKEMVVRYSVAKGHALAYTMDVAVVKSCDKEGRDLALLEMHPYCAVGNYGCSGAFLPMMYKAGLRWYIDYNTPMKETKE